VRAPRSTGPLRGLDRGKIASLGATHDAGGAPRPSRGSEIRHPTPLAARPANPYIGWFLGGTRTSGGSSEVPRRPANPYIGWFLGGAGGSSERRGATHDAGGAPRPSRGSEIRHPTPLAARPANPYIGWFLGRVVPRKGGSSESGHRWFITPGGSSPANYRVEVRGEVPKRQTKRACPSATSSR
jgi:hypothetical protein